MTIDDRFVHNTLNRIHRKHPMPTSNLTTHVKCVANQKGRGHERTIYWIERLLESMREDEQRGFQFCQDRKPVEKILNAAKSGGWKPADRNQRNQ